jgi:hypothetical protein
MQAATFQPLTLPQPIYTEGKALGSEITRLCAHIHAATYRLLLLIREFDEKKYWGHPGLCSCAHWLNFQSGIGMNAAREKVRVAHALKDLPGISERFRKGELSYSKVRAMTRVADAANEDYLLMIAKHGTAHHVEKLVSQFRRCKRLQDTDNANRQQAARSLHCHFDEDGSMVIRGRLPAEQGALIMKALELAMDRAGTSEKARLKKDASGVTAETSRSHEPFHANRADALAEMAETYLNGEAGSGANADRYQVMLHVTPAALREKVDVEEVPARVTAVTSESDVTAVTSTTLTADVSYIEDGPHLAAETARRICCDGSIVKLVEDEEGQPRSIGRKSRTIPLALRRALRVRDRGCRFPGCTHTAYIDGHHVQHWADGGETSLENLVMLCRRHHRMVHEGGYSCERKASGDFVFTDPYQRPLPASPAPIPIDSNPEFGSYIESWLYDLDIDERTCVPHWYAGDRMDWDLAVWHMFQIEEKAQRQAN